MKNTNNPKLVKKQGHQGDVFFKRVASIPTDALPKKLDNNKIILAYGEVTGHSHSIVADETISAYEKNGITYLKISKEAILTHEEHSPAALDEGCWASHIQSRYTPEEIKRTAD